MRVIQERDGNNTPTVSYTRGNDLSLSLEGVGGIGGLLARSSGYSSGNWTSHADYYADGNGNITSLIDSNQSVVASYRYDPFGNIISKSGSLTDANVYRFSSKEVHVNSGMYCYGYRFYDPNLQRWISRDPIEEVGGINLYGFVGESPLESVDPLGLQDVYGQTVRLYPDDFIGPPAPGYVTVSQSMAMASQMGLQPSLLGELLIPSGVGGCLKASAMSKIGRAESATAAMTRGQLARTLSQEENALLRSLFGTGKKGAESALAKLSAGGKIPPGLTKKTLETYKKIAQKTIEETGDKGAIQAERLKVIEEAAKQCD
jgi:RHS repeat-associated protein